MKCNKLRRTGQPIFDDILNQFNISDILNLPELSVLNSQRSSFMSRLSSLHTFVSRKNPLNRQELTNVGGFSGIESNSLTHSLFQYRCKFGKTSFTFLSFFFILLRIFEFNYRSGWAEKIRLIPSSSSCCSKQAVVARREEKTRRHRHRLKLINGTS